MKQLDTENLIEMEARGELGAELSSHLATLAAEDPAVADALARAKEDYQMMINASDTVLSDFDIGAARAQVWSKVKAERKAAIAFALGLPLVFSAFAALSLAHLEDATTADVWRAFSIIVGLSLACWVSIALWWIWFRRCAARAVSGNASRFRHWLQADTRAQKREKVIHIASWVTLLLLSALAARAIILDGSWSLAIVLIVSLTLCCAVSAARLLRNGDGSDR